MVGGSAGDSGAALDMCNRFLLSRVPVDYLVDSL